MSNQNIDQEALKPASNQAPGTGQHGKSWQEAHPVRKGGRPRKHGAYSFLRHGIIPQGKEYLADMADAAVARMAEDLGGLDHLSGNQVCILREIRQLMIFKFIIDERIMSDGLFKPGAAVELQGPLNGFYLSCVNTITRNCGLLGLKKVSPAADDLHAYLSKAYPVIEQGKP